ncbi:hypothetical protein E2C01_040130 [Portunus trituberculatus]|uniref:Uncharacterized protein n=1 Tax=Portunus trituberculatus TaxID=210409 RepID=A0A5B7FFM6_PORTR|nr:hypothetical protein [Portunus trituberculatus]
MHLPHTHTLHLKLKQKCPQVGLLSWWRLKMSLHLHQLFCSLTFVTFTVLDLIFNL